MKSESELAKSKGVETVLGETKALVWPHYNTTTASVSPRLKIALLCNSALSLSPIFEFLHNRVSKPDNIYTIIEPATTAHDNARALWKCAKCDALNALFS